ncbi:hypothetical protein NE237_009905 [Protea cynaroides]|uniref:Uncharacterized protein n=1 Tax=Protea cynaroides TaxID=273540 RepID=A0A9Q0R161_9MAGN|nr:hypothetical protein NE237_009905 [Protea cynaroides]
MVLLAVVKRFVDHERNFESIFNGDGLSITSTFWCWSLQSLMLGLSVASSLSGMMTVMLSYDSTRQTSTEFDARVIRGIFFVWNGDGDVVKRFHKTNVNRFLTASLLALLPLPRYRHFLRNRLRCCHRYFRFRK